MIILITASLSSKVYSIAPNRENFAFDGTRSTLFRAKDLCSGFLRDIDFSMLGGNGNGDGKGKVMDSLKVRCTFIDKW